MAQQKKQIDQEKLGQAIDYGIQKLVNENPRFKGFENYLYEHLDKKALNHSMAEIIKSGGQDNFYTLVSEYVARGKVLDEKGQRIVLGQGKKKSFFRRKTGDLEKIADSATNLSGLLSNEAYTQYVPEIAQEIYKLNQARFLDTTLDIMKEEGIINDKKYKVFKQAYRQGMEQGMQGIQAGMQKYADSYTQKIAAGVLLVIGFGILIPQLSSITGASIGTDITRNLSFWAGAILVGIGSYLGFKIIKRKSLN